MQGGWHAAGIRSPVDSDAVLLAAAPKRSLVDAEDIGRLLQRAYGGEDAPDVLFLDPVQAD